MKLFVDTGDINEVRRAAEWGILDGVTTNPTLIAKAGKGFKETVLAICDAVPGGDIRFTPHFYVNDTKHPNVYEVNGADFMEKALTVEKASLDKERPDTAEIAARAALMTDFTQALVFLAFDDLASAGSRIAFVPNMLTRLGFALVLAVSTLAPQGAPQP